MHFPLLAAVSFMLESLCVMVIQCFTAYMTFYITSIDCALTCMVMYINTTEYASIPRVQFNDLFQILVCMLQRYNDKYSY